MDGGKLADARPEFGRGTQAPPLGAGGEPSGGSYSGGPAHVNIDVKAQQNNLFIAAGWDPQEAMKELRGVIHDMETLSQTREARAVQHEHLRTLQAAEGRFQDFLRAAEAAWRGREDNLRAAHAAEAEALVRRSLANQAHDLDRRYSHQLETQAQALHRQTSAESAQIGRAHV